MGVNSVLKFGKCSDGIVGLPDGAEHSDAVETESANLRETRSGDTAKREHGSAALIRCARI
jgi:hypothetical protein